MKKSIETISLDGGLLCLDFINTVSAWLPARQGEYLKEFEDLIRFAKRQNIFLQNEEKFLLLPAEIKNQIYRKTIQLRDILYQIFSQYIEQQDVPESAMQVFNVFLAEAYRHLQIEFDSGFYQETKTKEPSAEKILWDISLSAADALLTDKLHRVKSCGACGWLFLDTSKNGSRRWCNMQVCGSQAKSKNYYHRTKEK